MYGYIVLSEVGTLLVLKKLEGEDEEKTVNEVKKKKHFQMHNRSESWVISEILHERLQQLQKLNKHKHILGPKHSYFLQKKGVAKLTAVSNILFKLPFTPTATLSTTSACFESSRVTSDEFEKHQSVSEWSIIIGLVSDKKTPRGSSFPDRSPGGAWQTTPATTTGATRRLLWRVGSGEPRPQGCHRCRQRWR